MDVREPEILPNQWPGGFIESAEQLIDELDGKKGQCENGDLFPIAQSMPAHEKPPVAPYPGGPGLCNTRVDFPPLFRYHASA